MEPFKIYHLLILVIHFPKQICLISMEIERKVCGFEPKCTGNETYTDRKDTSCCLYCGCTDICLERNNCCWDKPGRRKPFINSKQQCLPARYKPKEISEDVSVDFYYTRHMCPDTYKDNKIKSQCENTLPDSLEEIRLVSSDDGKIVYKNKYCGLCHGEKSIIPWGMKIPGNLKCKNIKRIPNKNIEEWGQYIISNCIIVFKRPSEIDVRSVLCFGETKVIRQCNITGEWDLYDSELDNLCLKQSSSVIVSQQQELYSNPYCYLCNKMTNQTACYNTFAERSKTSFTTLINFDKWIWATDKLYDPYIGPCKNDEIMDTFFGRCRRLFCPFFSVPIHGKCITVLYFGQSTLLVMRLVSGTNVYKSEDVKKIVDSAAIQKTLWFSKCFSCSKSVYRKISNETDVYVGLCLQETENCPLEYIWTKTFEARTKDYFDTSVILHGKRVNIQLYSMNEKFQSSKYEILNLEFEPNTLCRPLTEEMQLCSNVQLTLAEYKTVIRTHINAEKLIFTSNEAGTNDTEFVCCQNYIISSQSKETKANGPDYVVVTVAFLSLIQFFAQF